MNKGIYRLVFNAVRAVWMAVGEYARGHVAGSGKRRRPAAGPLVFILFFAGIPVYAGTLAPNTVPTGLTVTTGAHTTINAPVVNPANAAGQLLTIQQADTKAILQGANFNIGSASRVLFNHSGGAGSATLVRINGPKTVIEGALTAPGGDIYLLNQNGILFGNGARVNVRGLVASALDLEDSDFLNDLGHLHAFADGKRPAYVWKGDADGFATTLVQVEPDARIKAQLGGSVMLFAPKVLNQGSIETSEGQVVMAAGGKVYLSFTPDPNEGTDTSGFKSYAADSPYRSLAGVLVEVDPHVYQVPVVDGDGNPVLDAADKQVTETKEKTGQVVNDTMGRILAQRGNVTMASFLVNQKGRITATTSAYQKGSIRLLARDSGVDKYVEKTYYEDGKAAEVMVLSATRTGALEFGVNSVTEILPEGEAGQALARQHLAAPQTGEPAAGTGESGYLDSVLSALADQGQTLTDEQTFSPPTLEAVGKQVSVLDGARIVAPGGHIRLRAQNSTAAFINRLYLGENTLIDASGLKGVDVSLERNFVEVLLTLNDLRDDALNKDGFLYRKKVWFDIRDLPDTRVADLSGYPKQVPRSIAEKLAAAGSVVLQSNGDIVQRAGSLVDVSGGSLSYASGAHKESWLVSAAGKIYAIGSAPADTVFTGFLGGGNYRETREQGYTEGKAAGKLTINASSGLALDGSLAGGAVYGEKQRESANLGGTLSVAQSGRDDAISIPALDFVNGVTPLSAGFGADSALPADRAQNASIDTGMLSRSGFENMMFRADGNIRVHDALNLSPGSNISLIGRSVEVNDDIVARGGSITLESKLTLNLGDYASTGLAVGQGVTLDASGLWSNDYLTGGAGAGRILNKGGSISLSSASDVTLGAGSLLDVSGGGWLQSNAKLKSGDAGSISITSNAGQQISEYLYDAPALLGELRGYALGRGGSLSITAPFVTVGASGFGDARELVATPDFFQRGGFADFSLTGRDGVLVRGGTRVDVKAQNYLLKSNYLSRPSGSHVHDFAGLSFLPDYLRHSTSLALSTQGAFSDAYLNVPNVPRGSVIVEPGAVLQVDSNGLRKDSNGNVTAPRIALTAWNNLLQVDGTLQARGGEIALLMRGGAGSDTDLQDRDLKDNDTYNNAQAIWLGSSAKLLAQGQVVQQPNSKGLRQGVVYDGGTVRIDANRGYVVAEAGSLIDVSGVSATFDTVQYTGGMPRYAGTTIAGNAGKVYLDAREGMLLDAAFRAGSPGALAGLLDIGFGRGSGSNYVLTFPGGTFYQPDQQWFVAMSQDNTFMPAGLRAGDNIESHAPGLAHISANSIMNGGFAEAVLGSEYGVRFDGDVTLSLARALGIDARLIEANGAVDLHAPYISFSDADTTLRHNGQFIAPAPAAGNGSLAAAAQTLDFSGNIAFSGFLSSAFASTGDIRLTGFSESATITPVGSLRGSGELSFTARQIYPTSLTDFTIAAEGAGGKVSFHGNGADTPVWSAAGSLTVQAATIEQGGVLKAPFGSISLDATDKLTLKNGSLTSVSAEGATIPFGRNSRDGLDYLYDFGRGTYNLTALPERAVKLSAPVVNQEAGSTVDVSGGGDLYAYEWLPGTGGSTDVLAAGSKLDAFGAGTTGAWAILPASKTPYGSYDTQYWQGSSLKPGDAVYLSGVPGLDAGYYTLLPARYALMPGAMLVSAVSGHQDFSGQAQARVDGSTLVSGHIAAYTNSTINSGYVQTGRTAGFVVRPGSDADKLAEYRDGFASEFFADTAASRQTADAGRFSIEATTSLALKGVLRSIHDAAAKGVEVDIAAPKLMVVDEGTSGEDGYLVIDESKLATMNVASLLLGGTRSNAADGSDTVKVVSSHLRIGAKATLQGAEIILAATDEVRLESGSVVNGTGSGGAGRDLIIGSATVDGDGALLRVSGGAAANLTRSNTDSNRGDMVVDSGATIAAGYIAPPGSIAAPGSMMLDATRNMDMDGALGTFNEDKVLTNVGSDVALAVAAGRISLGEPDGGAGVTNGLWLTETQFNTLETAASLKLRSYSTLDLYGAGSFGSSSQDLILQAAGIAGYQNAGKTAQITAGRLTLDNSGNAAFSAAPALSDGSIDGSIPELGSGSLQVNATTIETGNNDFRLAGFSQASLSASGEITAQGAGALKADAAMTLAAARITASGAAAQTFEAKEALTLAANGVAGASGGQSAGAKLAFLGDSVLHQGTIDLPGGQVTLEATGSDSTDHVTLEAGSQILANGSTFTLYDQTIALPAGSVTLVSKSGNVEQRAAADGKAAALIDVSAAPGGDAGTLTVKAVNGKAILAGSINAANPADAKGRRGAAAEANIDVAAVAATNAAGNFSQTLAALQQFSGAQTYRVRGGDVAIGAADQVKTARFVLSADNGKVDVAGKVDASGDKGGSIEIYAKNDLTVQRGGKLLARGDGDTGSTAGTLGRGGSVTLSSDSGRVKAEVFEADGATRLADAAEIDVTGDQAGSIKGEAGKVVLRAGRSGLDEAASNAAFNPVTTAGTGAAYTAASAGFALAAGAVVAFEPHANSTSAVVKLNVAGTGAKEIKKNGGSNLTAGDLKSGKTYLAVYDGTNFQLVSSDNLANGSGAVGSGVKVDAATTGAITGAGEVLVEAVKVYEKNAIDAAFQKQLAADTVAFASRSPSVLAGFARTRDGLSATLAPGVEVRASGSGALGNLTLNAGSDWNLGSTAAGAIPMTGGGVLTLRAAGDLDLKSSIDYEQFVAPRSPTIMPALRAGSWSYRLAGGSDFTSVNPEAVKNGAGDFKISTNNKFVRTGTGFIHASAGKNITLNSGAAIYTEGLPDILMPAEFAPITGSYTAYRELYPDGGGDVRLTAGAAIKAGPSTPETLLEWLYKASVTPDDPAYVNDQLRWWSRFESVRNLVGTLGGGDVYVRAGGDVKDIQIVASGNGRMGGDRSLAPDMANFKELGGGDVDVRADGNMSNTLLFVSKGEASAHAGKDFSGQFALMDGAARVSAGGDVTLTSVLNPTTLKPPGSPLGTLRKGFYSYSDNAGVHAFSATGDVSFEGGGFYPANLFAAAPAGDIVTSAFTLYPAAQGSATLLAGDDLTVSLNMSELNPAGLNKVSTSPLYDTDIPNLNKYSGYLGASAHTPGLLHGDDNEPVRFYAGDDVSFGSGAVVLPKPVHIKAGNDVVDPNLIVQNLRDTDISLIEAGGSIRYAEPVPLSDGKIPATNAGIQVAGPGRLHLIAGKDIDLGSSDGVRSVGDLYNPYLPANGADILVNPGAAAPPDYSAMIAAYIDPDSAGAYAAAYLPQLLDYMRARNGDSGLSEAGALAAFRTLGAQQQAEFVNKVFYDELRAGGRQAIDSNDASFGDYSRAQRAILRMFPDFTSNRALASQTGSLMAPFKSIADEAVSHPGDLKLFYSQIRSERGGRIELMVPGGYINTGLAAAGSLVKSPTDLGIVSLRGGEIEALVRGDFQVNQSRVFTLGGSDLMLFSALADIDAGRGAKTASATPPPVLRVKDGQVFYDYSGAVSGSGIAALVATGGETGTVDLYAPYGEINAGEAGIRSVGNINLGALMIRGADNISAGGVTSGMPAADTSGLSLSVGGVTDAASAGKSGDQMAQAQAASQPGANQDSFLPTLISVEVIGLGSEEQDEKNGKEKRL